MSYSTILLTKEGKVTTLTLNRPDKLNAWNAELIGEVAEAADELNKDDTVGAVILTGAGRAFCAGGDLSLPLFDMKGYPPEMKDFFHKVNKIPLSLRNLRKPVIAAVNGPMAFVNVGYHPDAGASYFLPRLVGINKACELIFTGRIIDASEAERIGLVNQVVAADALLSTAKELADKLANGPSLAISLAKTTIYNGLQMTLEQALEIESQAASLILQTEDQKEGTNAFREKRKAVYKGR